MKHNPLPCGHKMMPPAIQETFGEFIDTVFCPICKKWMPWKPAKEIQSEQTGSLFEME
jgi:hypothetical protein